MNGELDPTGANVFASAVQWLSQILLGTIAQTIAVIAVASIGFLLLSGRIDVRRAVQVIFGCFILFGSSWIAAGILKSVNGSAGAATAESSQLPPPPPAPAAVAAGPYDPYAGAAMPTLQ